MMPVDEKFTTQAAANYLGVSRQHLVDLLEAGEIAFHKAGTHRRIAFNDLLEYEDKRDGERHEGLNRMFRKVAESGKYEGDFKAKTR
ncbi:MAG: helix-turn-helix domain-containing protein [Verrucomicrobia bacterium]|nr:MAG: helix-turn-helix domain-containing protein [Verrucomicrobiota bacterium]